PSTLAYAPQISAVPDTISQDGGSQARITVSMIGPDGRPVASQTFRVDMAINSVGQDFGTLSAPTVVTNASGVANVTYTATITAAGAATGNSPSACSSGLPGNCVQIVATPTGPPAVNDAQTATPLLALVRLVPVGVILPPGETPTPAFTSSP